MNWRIITILCLVNACSVGGLLIADGPDRPEGDAGLDVDGGEGEASAESESGAEDVLHTPPEDAKPACLGGCDDGGGG